jgi:hypothetical protein
MYARWDRLAAELTSSSDDGSEDDTALNAAARYGPPAIDKQSATKRATQRGTLDAAGDAAGEAAGGASDAFQRIKTHCVGLLGAGDVADRDAALQGIAAEFGALERHAASSLAKFAMLPLLLLLRDADAQRPGGASSGPPMAVHKERGIELALAAMSAVVKAGGADGDEALDVLTAAAHIVHKPAAERARPSEGGQPQTGGVELRASEVVVCAAVDAIMVVMQDLRRQESESESGECSLAQAWQDKSAALGHVVASLLAVGKAGDSVAAATRQQAVEAVELMFLVIRGPLQRAAFYVPGVVSAMARILVTSTSKGTRSRLGAAALSCWRHISSRFLADNIVQGVAEDLARNVDADLDTEHASTPPQGRAGTSETVRAAGGEAHKSLELLRLRAMAAESSGGERAHKSRAGTGGDANEAPCHASEAPRHASEAPCHASPNAQHSGRAMKAGVLTHSVGGKTGDEAYNDAFTVCMDASWRATVAGNCITPLNPNP